jgi:hypothetical protein
MSACSRINPRDCNTPLGTEPLIISGTGNLYFVEDAFITNTLPTDYLPNLDDTCRELLHNESNSTRE